MCGIAGVVGMNQTLELTKKIIDDIVYRGPDNVGFAETLNGTLGMCQLKIRNKKTDDVPLWYEPLKSYVAYNGEVYGVDNNNQEKEEPITCIIDEVNSLLRYSKIKKTNVDSMFAIAILFTRQAQVKLERDLFGIKPLFWRQLNKDCQVFCSELSPLIHLDKKTANLRMNSIAELLAFGTVLGTGTPYTGIQSVKPGTAVYLDGKNITVNEHRPNEKDIKKRKFTYLDVKSVIRESVKNCLDSKRTIGLALSGGLDSTILAYELNALGIEGLKTISVQIPGTDDGISTLEMLGLPKRGAWTTWQHHTVKFNSKDLIDLFPLAISSYGQPSRMTSIPLYLALSKRAYETGIVVLLTGEGSDELFGGYNEYWSWLENPNKLSGLERLKEFAFPIFRKKWIHALLGQDAVTWCEQRFDDTYKELDYFEPFKALRCLERSIRLEPLLVRLDHCLMKYSIEGRTPFLQGGVPMISEHFGVNDLLKGGKTKSILRLAYQKELTKYNNINKRKTPFRAPVDQWFSNDLSDWIRNKLNKSRFELEKVGFNWTFVNLLQQTTIHNNREAANLCYIVVSIAEWIKSLKIV